MDVILRRLLFGCVWTGVLFLCSGCATSPHRFYAGAPRPEGEIAVLRSEGGSRSISLMKINNIQGTGNFGFNADWRGGYWVELPPGDYVLDLRYDDTIYNYQRSGDLPLKFQARQGRRYTVQAKTSLRHGLYVEMWVEDVSNQQGLVVSEKVIQKLDKQDAFIP